MRYPGGGARGRLGVSKNEYIPEDKLAKTYKIGETPYFEIIKMGTIKSWPLTEEQARIRMDMRRPLFTVLPNTPNPNKL